MVDGGGFERWRTDGKLFRSGVRRVYPLTVTYGPFPGGWPEDFEADFNRIAEAGFNSIRVYEMPEQKLLDAAWHCRLRVFGGLCWGQHADFLGNPALIGSARVALVESLRRVAGHPALVGVYVGNEIPADLVRWMGPARVLHVVEDLIALGRKTAPHLMFAYANYPSTEYLEPANADFTAFNIYLENPDDFRAYLKRLHHIAGDRPLVVSEFGMDSRRNGTARQAETLAWASRIAGAEDAAGFTVYAWSDRWWNSGAEVTDWDFGLLDRAGKPKAALMAVTPPPSPPATRRSFSVIVCTRNGRGRIGGCLGAISRLQEAGFETIVVDDGSDDDTAGFIESNFPSVRLLRLAPCGLSAARNAGAAASCGEILAFTDDDCEPDPEWLCRLERIYQDGRFAAVGGPNLPPVPRTWHEAVVCAAPGAPSHVMLDDEEAEHLPGCNLTVTRHAFDAIGGFDPAFHTAGDDVDFCWRLRAAGFRLGFAPGAFVWHWRRPSIRMFLKQQRGYGRAERLLIAKHPEKFSRLGEAKWQGFIYGGGPVRVTSGSIIYHGPMGSAGYQSLVNRMIPLRGIDDRFNGWTAGFALDFTKAAARFLRSWSRNRRLLRAFRLPQATASDERFQEFILPGPRQENLNSYLSDGWISGGPTDRWDAEKGGFRILMACGQSEDGSRHTLVRMWGCELPNAPALDSRLPE